MLTPCPGCSHPIRSEVRSFGTFRTVVYFDDEERGGTHAMAVWPCPGCGTGLRGHVPVDAPDRRVFPAGRSLLVSPARSGQGVTEG